MTTNNPKSDNFCDDCDWVDSRPSLEGMYFVCTCPRRGTCSRVGGDLKVEDVSDSGRPDLRRLADCMEKRWKDAE
jgi:hypothetical protein